MLLPAIILSLLASAAPEQPGPSSPILVTGHAWAPFISPMGEPFRSRAPGDDTLRSWFVQADRNRDGVLIPAEMQADAERFFAALDADRSGEILPEEITAYEWKLVPEVQLNSEWRRARGEAAPAKAPKRPVPYDAYALHGGARYALLNLPQPVAAADSDFDRAVTLTEFRNAAELRFQLLDRAGDRQLSWADLEALRPPLATKARRSKARKGEPDKRLAVPVPLGD